MLDTVGNFALTALMVIVGPALLALAIAYGMIAIATVVRQRRHRLKRPREGFIAKARSRNGRARSPVREIERDGKRAPCEAKTGALSSDSARGVRYRDCPIVVGSMLAFRGALENAMIPTPSMATTASKATGSAKPGLSRFALVAGVPSCGCTVMSGSVIWRETLPKEKNVSLAVLARTTNSDCARAAVVALSA
jgi:hypothetical protein